MRKKMQALEEQAKQNAKKQAEASADQRLFNLFLNSVTKQNIYLALVSLLKQAFLPNKLSSVVMVN